MAELIPYCARCGMPIFIALVNYKEKTWHHGCYNMEIRDETVKAQEPRYTPRTSGGRISEW